MTLKNPDPDSNLGKGDASVDPRAVIVQAALTEHRQFDAAVPPHAVRVEGNRSLLGMGLALMESTSEALVSQIPQEDASLALALPTVAVRAPEPARVLALSPQQRQTAVHVMVSTNQGRQTLTQAIGEDLLLSLKATHPDLVLRPRVPDRKVTVKGYAEYRVSIHGGKGNVQPAFDFLRTATKLLTLDLSFSPPGEYLEVGTLNNVDIRSVGWFARIVVDGGETDGTRDEIYNDVHPSMHLPAGDVARNSGSPATPSGEVP